MFILLYVYGLWFIALSPNHRALGLGAAPRRPVARGQGPGHAFQGCEAQLCPTGTPSGALPYRDARIDLFFTG